MEPQSGYRGSAVMPGNRLGPQERCWPGQQIRTFQQTQKPPITRQNSTALVGFPVTT